MAMEILKSVRELVEELICILFDCRLEEQLQVLGIRPILARANNLQEIRDRTNLRKRGKKMSNS